MVHTVTLDLESSNGATAAARFSFGDEEWDLIKRAGVYAAELKQRELMDRGIWSTKLTIRWDARRGFSTSGVQPSDEDVIVVLHRLRPLILESEPTYFSRIVNLIARRTDSAAFQRRLEVMKKRFVGLRHRDLLEISIDGEVVNSEAMLKTYLNAFEYHRDLDKRASIGKLHEVLPSEAIRGIFVQLIVEKLKAIRGLEILIDLLQGKQKAMRI